MWSFPGLASDGNRRCLCHRGSSAAPSCSPTARRAAPRLENPPTPGAQQDDGEDAPFSRQSQIPRSGLGIPAPPVCSGCGGASLSATLPAKAFALASLLCGNSEPAPCRWVPSCHSHSQVLLMLCFRGTAVVPAMGIIKFRLWVTESWRPPGVG